MKKVFSILMVAFAVTTMVACGDKNNGTDNPSDNPSGQTDYLPAGTYYYGTEDYENYHVHVLSVLFDEERDITYMFRHSVEEEGETYSGVYNFSGNSGKGVLELRSALDGSDAGTAEFTYDHNNAITVTYKGETVTMTKTD